MLVKKVPDHLIAKNPIDTRSFEEHACVWRGDECLTNGSQQLNRIFNRFDHMPTNHDIGGNMRAIGAVVAALKPDASVEIGIWPNIARVEPIAAITGVGSANQLF